MRKMNEKGINRVFAGIIIAIVLLATFVGGIALMALVESSDVAPLGPTFATDPEASTGVLGESFQLVHSVEISSARLFIFMQPGGLFPGGACTASMWIQNDVGQPFGAPLVQFSDAFIAYIPNAQASVSENALRLTVLDPGFYQFVISLNCLGSNPALFEWRRGLTNAGTSGTVLKPGLQDYDNDGLWADGQNAFTTLILDGTIVLIPEPTPDGEPPPDEDAGLIDTITEDGDALIDTTAATTQIIIGIIVLIVGIFFMGVGTRGGTVIFTVIGFILIIVGLAIIAFGAIPFFAPALAIREEKVSNMLKGSLNLKKRRTE